MANIVLELRNLGALLKEGDTFRIDPSFQQCNQASFVGFVTDKLSRNTACRRLAELGLDQISISDVRSVLEGIFQAYDFKERTWNSYVQHLMSWIVLSDLDLKKKLVRPGKGGRRGLSGIREQAQGSSPVRISPTAALEVLNQANDGIRIASRRKDDLVRMGLLAADGGIKNEGIKIIASERPIHELCRFALSVPKIREAFEISKSLGKLSASGLLKALPETYFSAPKISSKINYATILVSWLKPLR